MADRKISDLTALTTPATGDLIPIVDISEAAAADKNKSITVGELLRGAPDGTAAAPGIAFESDGGNGMFLGGTDILAFSTGGSQAVTIDASQRVGIGVSTLSNVLHVHQTDASANSYVHITQADGGSAATDGLSIGIEDGGVNAVIRNRENGYLRIYTNDEERVRIDSSGNFGINSTSPSSFGKFVVRYGDNRYTAVDSLGRLTARYDDNSASIYPVTIRNTGITSIGHGAHLRFFLGQSTSSYNGGLIGSIAESDYSSAANADAALVFQSANNNGHTERLRITSDGYVRLDSSASGIQFNGDTAAANALDDYEEGTWQPTVTTGTVSYAFARYTKIGRQVTVAARLSSFSDTTSSAAVVVGNLPYNGDGSNAQAAGSAFFRYVNNQFTTVYVDGDDLLFYLGGAGGFDSMQHQDITDSSCEIYFFATYFTA